MRQPEYPARAELLREQSLDDLARTLALLRRAVRQRGRIDVETFSDCLERRLGVAPLAADDRAELAATVRFLRRRTEHGLSERLRQFLLPLVAALEKQMEISCALSAMSREL